MKFKKITLLVLNVLLMVACTNKNEIVTKPEKKFEAKETKYKKDNTTEVLVDKDLNQDEIVSYYKHGDHWHVITKDGKEHITYTDPEKAKDLSALNDIVEVVGEKDLDGNKIVAIKKHGDHWHLYTADGKEYLSYDDPSKLYPHILIGQYDGKDDHGHNHNDDEDNHNVEDDNNKHQEDNNTNTQPRFLSKSEVVAILGKPEVDLSDIIRILKHENHWHIFDSKGNEAITYFNPKKHYPNAQEGEYEGDDTHNSSQDIVWPEGITKIIDHGDHWHLYIGDKEVSIVKQDPRPHYPHAEVIKETTDDSANIAIDSDELFTYDEVPAELIESVLPFLSENLKAMTHFGNLDTNLAVFGSNGEKTNIFYWLHGDHYHAISIKQIIQKAKAKEFGDNSAKDVVAVLKYKILNPDANLELEVTVEFEEVQKFLMDYYGIGESRDVMYLYGVVQIYKNGEVKTIHMNQFEKVDNKIRAKVELPSFSDVINPEDEKDGVKPEIQPKDPQQPSKPSKDQLDKEKENILKIAEILEISEDEAFDAIYEIIDDVSSFRIADLIINEQEKTVSLNGKEYPLIFNQE